MAITFISPKATRTAIRAQQQATQNVIAMVVLAGTVLAEKIWVWGPQFSRVLGVAALGLAVTVVFVPGLAPGLQQVASPGQMGGM